MIKIIITEEQAKNLVSKVITEENIDTISNKVVQCFLNKLFKANLPIDGLMGDNTSALIKKYQTVRGVYPTDGVWGESTASKLTQSDILTLKECGLQYRDLYDKIMIYLGFSKY